MSFLDRFRRKSVLETRNLLDNPAVGWTPLDYPNGVIGPALAQQIAAVGAAVDLLSTSIAALPVSIYQESPDGTRIDRPDHPAARLLTRPNGFQTWFEWVVYTISSVLLEGNALSVIQVDQRGAAVALTPVPWSCVRVTLTPAGALTYTVTGMGGDLSATRTYAADEVLHLKDRPGASPYVGQSRLHRCSKMIDSALAVQDFAVALFRNSARPAGMVTLPPRIDPAEIRRIESWMAANYGGERNAGKTILAENGTTFTPLSSNAEESQVLGTRAFLVQEIARLFGIPAQMLADPTGSTYTNSATATIWLAQNGLRPWIVNLEQAFDRSVIAEPGVHLGIDLSGMLRGDALSASTALIAEVGAGVISVDEARRELGYGPMAAAATEPDGPVDTD